MDYENNLASKEVMERQRPRITDDVEYLASW